jgi:hypothetical protein
MIQSSESKEILKSENGIVTATNGSESTPSKILPTTERGRPSEIPSEDVHRKLKDMVLGMVLRHSRSKLHQMFRIPRIEYNIPVTFPQTLHLQKIQIQSILNQRKFTPNSKIKISRMIKTNL